MIVNVFLIALIAVIALCGVRSAVKRAKGESCCGGGPSEVKIEPSDKNKKNYPYRAELEIDGMKCAACAFKVQNKLNSLEGVWAKVSFKKKNAELLLKQADLEDVIKKTVADAGYSVVRYNQYAIRPQGLIALAVW